MLGRLKWIEIPDAAAKKLAVLQFSEMGKLDLDSLVFKAAEAKLPFYKNFCLCRLESTDSEDGFSVMSYVLSNARDVVISVNGKSDAIHTANDFEHLQLSKDNIESYIRFFLFCVRGEEGAFNLVETLPEQNFPGAEAIAPLEYLGMDEEDRYRYKAIIAFSNTLVSSVFAVSENGAIEMVDDLTLADSIPEAVIPNMPSLDGPMRMMEHLLKKIFKTGSPESKAGNIERHLTSDKSDKSALVTLAEMLLERSMSRQAKNRLISHFNAIQSGSSGLDQLANLVADAAPIIAIESNLPFIGEIIADIVINRIALDEKRTKPSLATISEQYSNNLDVFNNNVIVLLQLQILSTTVNLERIFHDMATKDLAVIVTCDKFNQMPENLRAITDIVLKLPAMDAGIFEELFERVIGSPAPDCWRQQGDAWSKYVLHTDFEHPRRMKMPPDKAFAYIRDQVKERVAAVDPVQGMGLNELHGLGEARQFAEDLIADIHAAIGGKIPWSQVDRGALLAGPPGTGKTTLAKAIAKDCNVKFIQVSATAWQASSAHLNEHISAIRKTFAEARRYAPSILFIDEIDSLGNREYFTGENGSQYQTEVINAVLEQIQGVDADEPVFVLGATNHEDRVDPALKRSGRMDRVIQIPRPNSEALGQIFGHYLGKLESGQADSAIDPAALGRLSVGMTGADVERIVRGAARRARRVGGAISQMDIIAEITNKPRNAGSSLRITPEELERTAYHEAGHAVAMTLSVSQGEDIGFITIVPRDNGALGFVKPNDDERVSYTRKDYEETIEVYLAGRVAEAIRYGEENVSSGATSDLKAATHLAISMVTKLGFGRSRKLLWTETPSEEDLKQAEQLISQMYDRIRDKLLGSKAALTNLAEELKARQELTGDEVRGIILQGKGKG